MVSDNRQFITVWGDLGAGISDGTKITFKSAI